MIQTQALGDLYEQKSDLSGHFFVFPSRKLEIPGLEFQFKTELLNWLLV